MKYLLRTGTLMCVALLAGSAVHAGWPAGSSFLLFEPSGFDLECVDVRRAGTSVKMYWAGENTGLLLVEEHPGTARSSMTFTLRNGWFGGIYPTKETIVDCSCSRRGAPWWYVTPLPGTPGNGSCSCVATYRFSGGGSNTEQLIGIDLAGVDCGTLYGTSATAPRIQRLGDQPAR